MSLVLSCPRVLTGESDLGPGWVRIGSGQVLDVGTGEPPGPVDVGLPDGVLVPGLVDAQVNGAFGIDLANADPAGWAEVAARLPSTGVTGFLPTLTSGPVDDLVAGVRRHREVLRLLRSLPGAARSLGVHLEGPFLAPARRGVHPSEHLRRPDPEIASRLLDLAAEGSLACVTLAPELPGALSLVTDLTAAGVRVAVGHTEAGEDDVLAAVSAGATLVTHLFNAMPPLHHRAVGPIGVALTDPRLTCGLIADGQHVAPRMIRLALGSAPGRVMLVTDAVAALGLPPGRYRLGDREIITTAGGGPAVAADGTLAGGCLPLDAMVDVTVAAGVPLRDAVEAATGVPSAALGRPDLGRLAPGCPADVVWLAPAPGTTAFRARATWVGGRLAHDDGTRPELDRLRDRNDPGSVPPSPA